MLDSGWIPSAGDALAVPANVAAASAATRAAAMVAAAAPPDDDHDMETETAS